MAGDRPIRKEVRDRHHRSRAPGHQAQRCRPGRHAAAGAEAARRFHGPQGHRHHAQGRPDRRHQGSADARAPSSPARSSPGGAAPRRGADTRRADPLPSPATPSVRASPSQPRAERRPPRRSRRCRPAVPTTSPPALEALKAEGSDAPPSRRRADDAERTDDRQGESRPQQQARNDAPRNEASATTASATMPSAATQPATISSGMTSSATTTTTTATAVAAVGAATVTARTAATGVTGRARSGGNLGLERMEAEPVLAEDDVLLEISGILDVLDNYAFVRTSGYLPGTNDAYVSLSMVKKWGLRKGDIVTGAIRAPQGRRAPGEVQPAGAHRHDQRRRPGEGQGPSRVPEADPAVPAGALPAGDHRRST